MRELFIQSSVCPSKLLPLDQLDDGLKAFVHIEENYLAKKIQSQLKRYKDIIEEQKVSQTLSTYNLSNDQVMSFVE